MNYCTNSSVKPINIAAFLPANLDIQTGSGNYSAIFCEKVFYQVQLITSFIDLGKKSQLSVVSCPLLLTTDKRRHFLYKVSSSDMILIQPWTLEKLSCDCVPSKLLWQIIALEAHSRLYEWEERPKFFRGELGVYFGD